jgi:DNA recombination protein RmuC
LQTVLQGLKALQIEEQAVEIRQRVEDLGKHLLAYDDYMKKLGGTLGTSVSHYNLAYKEFKKIDKDVLRVTGTGGEVETLILDKPNIE